ncbi:GspH/FimT family pseudopilin [Glaciimonas sp. Gout2]|uniref:GspH/FimT family pseudopilin n=1 Tax=unclassified Glaciimonas TaxID=2644401 RepID=UPI002B236D83|nr:MULTISPECIES: GspH/FimT family pseudopilin [unclassified Glaciimonas]MEB0012637.1 GspH/FimT family pseudopilin [Glaciimonas sp. Cout2]MEB0083022.1 GspH/FimT family pseudopilin [Glaciimonas sp. Gout2]
MIPHSAVVSVPLSFPVFTLRYGFTLIEIMIAMLVVIILLAIGAPSMRAFIIETRMSIYVNQFVAAATLARTEAIKRGRSVVICRSVHAESKPVLCISSASEGRPDDDWGSGWIVMVPGEKVALLRHAALHRNTSVIGQNKVIKYDGLGRPGASFTKLVLRHEGKFERVICLSRSGRMNVLVGTSECG